MPSYSVLWLKTSQDPHPRDSGLTAPNPEAAADLGVDVWLELTCMEGEALQMVTIFNTVITKLVSTSVAPVTP